MAAMPKEVHFTVRSDVDISLIFIRLDFDEVGVESEPLTVRLDAIAAIEESVGMTYIHLTGGNHLVVAGRYHDAILDRMAAAARALQ